jgi:hypothetical protein
VEEIEVVIKGLSAADKVCSGVFILRWFGVINSVKAPICEMAFLMLGIQLFVKGLCNGYLLYGK